MSKKKKVFILILVLALINITVFTYVVWGGGSNDFTTEIPLGERAIISVSPTLSPRDKLVPLGSFTSNGEIDEYTFSYQVTFNKEGYLSIVINEADIMIGDGNNRFDSLVVVQVFINENPYQMERNLELVIPFTNWNSELQKYVIEVSIRVFVKAPDLASDYLDAYQTLRGSSISFTATFEAIKN